MRNGFVITELLIALVIIAIIAMFAAPSYEKMVKNNRLTAAAESLYTDMQLARSEAIRKQSNVFVAIQPGADWCYGLSDGGTCDCTIPNSCLLNSAEKVVKGTDYPGVNVDVTGLLANDVRFEGIHGTTGESGQANFTTDATVISVAVKSMGNIRACSSDIGGYSAC